MAKLTTKGMVNKVTRLEKTVKVMANAVSPLDKCVIKLEVGPAGQEAKMTRPTASSVSNPKRKMTPKAIKGKNTT